MSINNEDMYGIYLAGLAQAAGLPGSPSNLILAGTALTANFATTSKALLPMPTLPQALDQIYHLGDTEAFPNGFYSLTANSFFNNYATYIDNLVPQNTQNAPTPTQQGQINLIQSNLTAATTKYNSDLDTAYVAFNKAGTMFPGQYKDFQAYLNQTSWGGTLNTDANTVNGYNSQLNTINSSIYGADYVAIQLAKQTVDKVRTDKLGSSVASPAVMSVSVASGTLIVPTYNPSSLDTFSSWVDSTIQQHGNTGQSPINVTFTSSSAKYDFSQSTYFSQSSFNAGYWFFSTGALTSTSRSQVNIDTSSSQFSLTIGYDSITQVSIAPGPWYDSSLMYDYQKSNPTKLIRPTTLLVAMYPTIKLTMDAASYSNAQSAYNSSTGFSVGGFWCCASGSIGTQTSTGRATMNATWDASTNSVTMSSQSTTPVIVGMMVTGL